MLIIFMLNYLMASIGLTCVLNHLEKEWSYDSSEYSTRLISL